MTSNPPQPASSEALSRLSRDGLVRRIRYLEKELYRTHSVASANGLTIPPYKPPSPSPAPSTLPLPPLPSGAKSSTPAVATTQPKSKKGVKKKPQAFNSRHVALKLVYLGKNYGGFEFQASSNIDTVEEVIWKVLTKSCLIVPDDPDTIDWLPFQYSKCGRTDRGVSAFGQVISIRLRSSKPMPKLDPVPATETPASQQQEQQQESPEDISAEGPDKEGTAEEDTTTKESNTAGEAKTGSKKDKDPKREWDPIKDEIDYLRVMNRLFPPDVRAIAWCPTMPERFDARFSCRERRYKYFFTQPAFTPLPDFLETEELAVGKAKKKKKGAKLPPSTATTTTTPSRVKTPPLEPIKRYKDGWLDIEAMREAAKSFIGRHDFRNFCRIDGGKQINDFSRELFDVSIEEVKDMGTIVPYVSGEIFAPKDANFEDSSPRPKVYSFNVYGNAFLWHQIRCMIAILFLVGQGLEKATIVKDLLDVKKYPRKPQYTMADPVPLVLWDCLFPKDRQQEEDSLDWIYNSNYTICADHGAHGMYDHLWTVWRERKMDEIIANRLLDLYTKQGNTVRDQIGHDDLDVQQFKKHLAKTYRLYGGGNNSRTDGRYIPISMKDLQPSFAEVNDAFARRKGFKSSDDMKSGGNWVTEVRARKAAMLAAENEYADEYEAAGVGGTIPSVSSTIVDGPKLEEAVVQQAAQQGG